MRASRGMSGAMAIRRPKSGALEDTDPEIGGETPPAEVSSRADILRVYTLTQQIAYQASGAPMRCA